MRWRLASGLTLAVLVSCAAVVADVLLPDETRYVNQPVPDILIRSAEGETRLSTLWRRGPVVLTLVFTRCAGVCSPYLRSLKAADQALGAPPDVQRVVLSFDPRDTVADMRQSAEHLGVGGRPGWMLGVADPQDLARVTRALGFWSAWDPAREQFDHPAMLAGIRNGRLARLLVGGEVTPVRLGEVFSEARGQFVASYPLPGNVSFRCFDYDPATGRAMIGWGAAVLLVPALVSMCFTVALFSCAGSRSRVAETLRAKRNRVEFS